MSLRQKMPSVVELNGVQIQQAIQASPVAICYGSPKVPCNFIYANGFNAVKQKSGGKGILTGGKNSSNQWLYYATLIAAIGEGPIQNIIETWQDTNQWFNLDAIVETDPNTQVGKSGQPNTIPIDATFFPGGSVQEPWSYVSSRWPADARSYKDTCYVGLPNMQLDSSGTPPQFNFLPRGIFAGTCPLNTTNLSGAYTNNEGQFSESFFVGFIDADPATCVYDFLTNPNYGAGFPADLIDQASLFSNVPGCFDPAVGDSSLQTYAQAVGFGWSLVLNNTEAAGSVLERLMKNMAVAIVWTGETLKFIPYWDAYSGLNPGWDPTNPNGIGLKFFNPNVQPIMTLTDDHLLQARNPEEEPVTIDRIDPVDVYNYYRCNFKDRSNQFNDNVAIASADALVERFGIRVDTAQVSDEFSLMAYAQASATVQLARSVSIRRHITWRLPPVFAFFDPMDIVNVTSLNVAEGFTVRIVSIEEDDSGSLTIVGEEFPVGAASPVAYPGSPTTPPFLFQSNVPVGNINPPAIFEPTMEMLTAEGVGVPAIVIGTSASTTGGALDPNWGGCQVWASLDNASYVALINLQGSQTSGLATMGVLTATLPYYGGAAPDNTNVLSLNLLESDGELTSTTLDVAAQGIPTLCAIIDSSGCVELLSYTTATLTGANAFNLTGLYRGLYGTRVLGHSSGAQFLRLDNAIFQAALPNNFVGQTLYLKFTSFNIYNSVEQDLSDVDPVVYVPTGAGANLVGNPILTALQAGQPVDLRSAQGSLDCAVGGSEPCSPVLFNIDLAVG